MTHPAPSPEPRPLRRVAAPPRRLRRAGGALLALLVLLGTACGGGDAVGGGPAAEGPAPAGAAPDDAALPTLPPVDQRDPEAFDDQGCLVTGPGTSDCATTADDLDGALAGATEADERRLEGFVGPRWLESPTAGSLVVLADTVTVSSDAEGRWVATGLARNETGGTVGAVEVRATLVGADGTELGGTSSVSPVQHVRSGEPVPFEVRSEVTAAEVADVSWTVEASDSVGEPAARALELAVYWVRPAGDPQPIDLYLHRDAGDSRPQALFASVAAVGDAPVAAPRLVVAWLGEDGRVLAVDVAPVVTPTGEPAAELAAGAAGDALVLHAGEGGGDLASATPVLWGLGS